MLHMAASVTPGLVRRRARGLVRGAALSLLALGLAACASQPRGQSQAPAAGSTPPPSSSASASPAPVNVSGPVTIAFLAPTTASSEGARRAAQDLVAAAQMARSDLAPANLVMKVYDTRGTDAGAAEAAASAVRDGAALILGPLFGSSAAAVRPVAANAGLNVLAFSNDSSVAGGNVWVLGQLPADEMRRLFAYAGSQGIGTVALVHPQDPYGDQVARSASGIGRETGIFVGPVASYERSFNGIEAASRGAAVSINGSGSGGVLIADAGDALRSMAAFLSYYDVAPRSVKYMGLSRWDDGRNSAEGALRGGWFVAADPVARLRFEDRFAAQMSRRPASVAVIGYDAVAVAATLLRAAQAGGQPPFDVRAISGGAGYDGATGRFRLTADGMNRRSLAVMQVDANGLSVLDPAPVIVPGS